MEFKFKSIKGRSFLICLTLAGFFLLMQACKEVGPQINLHDYTAQDSTYVESPVATPLLRNVVIEEFTGTSCVNCPQGHALVASIQSSYETGRIAAVAFH